MARFDSVDAYIGSLRPDVRPKLQAMREAVRQAVPAAEEGISYDIVGFRLHGHYFVSLAGWKSHLSLYPIPDTSADPEFDRELRPYRAGKGTLRFPLAQPIPLELVGRVARLLAEQQAHAGTRAGGEASPPASPTDRS